jgi:hypothetical protein
MRRRRINLNKKVFNKLGIYFRRKFLKLIKSIRVKKDYSHRINNEFD